MRKVSSALVATSVVGATMIATAKPAAAFFWFIPVIIGAGAVGLGIGAATSNPPPGPPPTAYAEPAPTVYSGDIYTQHTAPAPGTCRIVRERVSDGYKKVRVCD
ncbi:MAG TPA: hypothetical protein VFB45_01580 [Pseudolabrys sp.]|nr:hypothetical protein [Pseudolabrys sp.]